MCVIIQCSESLEPTGILIIFLICIYRLKLKIKRLETALTFYRKVETVLLNGHQGWFMLLKSEISVTLGRELETAVLLSIPICRAK
jgi:hypothetical protein